MVYLGRERKVSGKAQKLFFKNAKRRLNEKKFPHQLELSGGGRRYWYEVKGKAGYKARYVKEVDDKEETTKFYQEIYEEEGILVEIHEKYTINKGQLKVKKEIKDDGD